MTDALIMGAILLVMVLLTQVGRHPAQPDAGHRAVRRLHGDRRALLQHRHLELLTQQLLGSRRPGTRSAALSSSPVQQRYRLLLRLASHAPGRRSLIERRRVSSSKVTTPNVLAGVVGAAIGLLAGFGLAATTTVERDPARGRIRTRAGRAYPAIWLAVLLGRLAFVWSVEHVHWFTVDVGEFMYHANLGDDGIGLFFVVMALTMVVVRAAAILVCSRRLHRPAAASLDTITV
jgi:hypothetical protein